MGTRSLICVYYKGRFIVAQYTQFDGYPEGQGLSILKFLRTPTNLIHLKEGVEHHIYNPTNDEIEEINKKVTKIDDEAREQDIANGNIFSMRRGALVEYYPSLSREVGAKILNLIATAGSSTSGAEQTAETKSMAELLESNEETAPIVKGEKLIPISLDLEFANDGPFCEWAYVVDLDKNLFEIFGGSTSKEGSTSKRFNEVGGKDDGVPALVKSFEIATLPDEDGYMDSFRDLRGEDEDDE